MLFATLWLNFAPLEPGKTVESLPFGGVERSYGVRLPGQVNEPGRRLPLVVLLHGFSGSGPVVETYTGFGKLSEREDFILVTPDGTGKPMGWNCDFITLGRQGSDDFGFLNTMLDVVLKKYPIDPKRIFVAGHSNGAMMANTWGGRRADKFAAIGAVAGVIGVGRTQRKMMADPKGGLSVLHIHGTADRVVAYDEQANALLFGPSAPDAVKWWAEKIGIKSEPEKISTEKFDVLSFRNSRHLVRLVTLPGWSHDWPAGAAAPIQASDTIWEFFKQNPKR